MQRIIILCLLLCSLGVSQQHISFQSKPLQDLLAEAKASGKLVFNDCYTTWCGPCKWMYANIFNYDTAADYYNANFICAHFDMEEG